MIFAEVYRREGTWKFRALGEPQATDNFVEILKKYINN
jgi:tellurium resistance protein TerD